MVKLPDPPEGVGAAQWLRAVAVAAAAEAAPKSVDYLRTMESNVLRLAQSFEHYIVTGETP